MKIFEYKSAIILGLTISNLLVKFSLVSFRNHVFGYLVLTVAC